MAFHSRRSSSDRLRSSLWKSRWKNFSRSLISGLGADASRSSAGGASAMGGEVSSSTTASSTSTVVSGSGGEPSCMAGSSAKPTVISASSGDGSSASSDASAGVTSASASVSDGTDGVSKSSPGGVLPFRMSGGCCSMGFGAGSTVASVISAGGTGCGSVGTVFFLGIWLPPRFRMSCFYSQRNGVYRPFASVQ